MHLKSSNCDLLKAASHTSSHTVDCQRLSRLTASMHTREDHLHQIQLLASMTLLYCLSLCL